MKGQHDIMASEIRSLPAGEFRYIVDGGKARINARAILFDSWSVDLGGFRERMMPGSVQLDVDLVALFDHDTSMVLGRVSAGTMSVAEDDRGVSFTAFPPETTWAADLRVSMERGDIKGCSYRMMVEEDNWYVENGQVYRDVLKATISELTVTSMPAYPETTAEARSHAEELVKEIPAEVRDAMEDSIYPVTPRQTALEDAIEGVVEIFGKFDQGTGEGGAHYVDAAANPFKADGIVCSNCTFFEGPRGCEIVDGDIDPNAACKFWIVPEALLAGAPVPAPTDSEMTTEDGASTVQSRSSVGATETPSADAPTYVAGFGFIPNRKES